jgi:acyl carrier protein
MTEEEILAGLTEILRETFADDQLVVTPETTAKDVAGWDSIRMVSILIAVEERFGIKTRSREIDRLRSVGDFVQLIQAKQKAA